MCCFSGPVEYVASTNIYARPLAEGRQALVYSMDIRAATDVAMILPLPVPRGSSEDAVQFVNLARYSGFFRDLARAFPVMLAAPLARGVGPLAQAQAPRLRVHNVGAFEAARKLFHGEKQERRKVVLMGGPSMAVWLCRSLRDRSFSIRLFETDRERAEELAEKLDWVTVIQAER